MGTAWKAVGTAYTRVSFEYYAFRKYIFMENKELSDLFYDKLDVRKNMSQWVKKFKDHQKYGDLFLDLSLTESEQFRLNFLSELNKQVSNVILPKNVSYDKTTEVDNFVKYVLALRYLYYCKNISIVEDRTYDAHETYAKTLDGGELLDGVSSDMEEDYSDEIKEKANFLLENFKKGITNVY